MDYIIKIKELIHRYARFNEDGNKIDDRIALNRVTLDIEKGCFLAILGHNGCGKSTLAKHLNCLLLPDEGTVFIQDMDTKDESKLWDIRQTSGMVFQNPDNQIIANIVEEDVAFGPENLGVPSEEIWQRVQEALQKVGMYAYRKKSPNKLSGGQKQRIAIAGIMAMKPKVIVLDEPTAMLDPSGRKEVISTIRELNRKEGVTVLLITHYMEEAVLADRVIVMENGQISMDGRPGDIFSRVEELKHLHMDVPQVMELAYELKREGLPLPDGILTTDEFVEELIKLA